MFQTDARSSRLFSPTAIRIAVTLIAAAAVIGLLYFVEMKATASRAEPANADLRREVAFLRHRLALADGACAQVEEHLSALTSQVTSLRGLLAATDATAEQPRLVKPFHRVGLIMTDDTRAGADSSQPEAVISDAPREAERESLGELARRAIGDLRRLIASTGLNVERLFPLLAPKHPEGGPFVPLLKGDPPSEMSPDKLAAIRSLLKSLPLATPLDYYQLESRFGPRYDPFNHKLSFHTGLDLSAPYMSPVYATAAGIVTYAGYYSDYGKVVEIDHGNGIATLYAHLHRFTVAVGQSVAEHEQIGFLGSTGRSSGPHVHYEVRVNDEPQDPEKFIGLARVIPATDR